jgi:hypothetical protein
MGSLGRFRSSCSFLLFFPFGGWGVGVLEKKKLCSDLEWKVVTLVFKKHVSLLTSLDFGGLYNKPRAAILLPLMSHIFNSSLSLLCIKWCDLPVLQNSKRQWGTGLSRVWVALPQKRLGELGERA